MGDSYCDELFSLSQELEGIPDVALQIERIIDVDPAPIHEADPEVSTTPSTPKIDIDDLRERLIGYQTMAASWIVAVDAHSYTHKMRSDIDDFLMHLTAALSHLEKEDLTYDELQEIAKQYDNMGSTYGKLKHAVQPFIDDAKAMQMKWRQSLAMGSDADHGASGSDAKRPRIMSGDGD